MTPIHRTDHPRMTIDKRPSGIFELCCILMIGTGQMLIMTGDDTLSFIVESVLHSVNSREPERIDAFAGYYGQATLYLSYTFSNFLAPSICHYFGAKMTLFLGSLAFTINQAGFLHLNKYYFYAANVLIGVGFSMYYSGQAEYVTGHSTRQTISRNSALAWALNSCCMMLGACVLIVIYSMKAVPVPVSDVGENVTQILNDTLSSLDVDHTYRDYSDSEIRTIFGVFLIITICANLVFGLLPSREVENSLNSEERHSKEENTFRQQMADLSSALTDPSLLLLAPLYMFWGTFSSYWTGAFPTTLVFTKALSGHIYMVPYYAIAFTIGELIIGGVVAACSKHREDFGMRPTMAIGAVMVAGVLALSLAAIPNRSTIAPNDEPALWLEPSVSLACVLGVLMGCADGCLATARTVITALVIPERRTQCFSISKFYQSMASSVTFFLTPLLTLRVYLAVMAVQLVVACGCYWLVTGRLQRKSRIADASASSASASTEKVPVQ